MIPLSLYIHFPWCIKKCPYCDFNSHALKKDLPETQYINILLQDLRHDLDNYKTFLNTKKIHSIFMGGGTPSLFSPGSIKNLLANINNMIDFDTDLEITLEANPGTFEQEKFAGFREAGINRLSIGIQSFQSDKLTALGRIHDGEASHKAIEIARKAGFDNINIDLMHGLPKQSVSDALTDIQTALDFSPEHLSWYQLTLEPNTLFYQKPPLLPPENILDKINQNGENLLHNYHHYEISAYAKPAYECRHNLNYWQFGDYLGIGAGAHSKLGFTRLVKQKHPEKYLNSENSGHYSMAETLIEPQSRAFEFMLNALRLRQKIPHVLLTERTGLYFSDIIQKLELLTHKKLLNFNNDYLELTPLGQRFLNDVLTVFL